jgi:phosphoglycolate phosphatase-like HAD superfamily hydrolase
MIIFDWDGTLCDSVEHILDRLPELLDLEVLSRLR